jgi:hypothetical protein
MPRRHYRSVEELRGAVAVAMERLREQLGQGVLQSLCIGTYTRVAEWEQDFAEEHELKNALELYEELFQRLEDPEVFPIRVGFGSGRLSLRLALLLPEDHPEGQEPKTRKTAGSREPQDGFPLGWMVGRLVG